MNSMTLVPCLAAAALLAAPAVRTQDPPKTTRAIKLIPAPAASAQSSDDLATKRKKKLAKPVFRQAAWHFDYDEARSVATKEGKLLLVYFTRSYSP